MTIIELISLDYHGVIGEYLTQNIIGYAYSNLKDKLKNHSLNSSSTFLIKKSLLNFQETLAFKLYKDIKWASEISFKDLDKSILINNVFISIPFLLTPRSNCYSGHKINNKIDPDESLDFFERNTIILGGPGAGKTTFSKKTVIDLLLAERKSLSKFDIPIVIRLRELNNQITSTSSFNFYRYLANLVGIELELSGNGKIISSQNLHDRENVILEEVVVRYLDEINAFLILDGFDEISHCQIRKHIIESLRQLSLGSKSCKFVLTSRTGAFDHHIINTNVFEICNLDNKQIFLFAKNWLGNEEKANSFCQEINDTPYNDTTLRPINLAHLCTLYERENKIPEKPKTIYRKITKLLIEEWDEQRSIERVSGYSDFKVDRKFDFLTKLAYEITVQFNGASRITYEMLLKVYIDICGDFGLPKSQAIDVVKELESHTGLFVQNGAESYEFSHKSLQEYLGAEYIKSLPSIPNSQQQLLLIPNELAITVSLSYDPNLYFGYLILITLKDKIVDRSFYKILLTRMAIERPDFNENVIAAISLLFIYGEKLGIELYETNDIIINDFSELLETFLINRNLVICFRNLLNYYNIEDELYQFNKKLDTAGKNVLLTSKGNYSKIYINGIEFLLPARLFIPELFVKYIS